MLVDYKMNLKKTTYWILLEYEVCRLAAVVEYFAAHSAMQPLGSYHSEWHMEYHLYQRRQSLDYLAIWANKEYETLSRIGLPSGHKSWTLIFVAVFLSVGSVNLNVVFCWYFLLSNYPFWWLNTAVDVRWWLCSNPWIEGGRRLTAEVSSVEVCTDCTGTMPKSWRSFFLLGKIVKALVNNDGHYDVCRYMLQMNR